MFGLVHMGLESMVTKQRGADAWEMVLEDAGMESDSVSKMRSYPDQVSFSLIKSVSKQLDLSNSECLEAFGEHWLLEFAPENYDSLLEDSGVDPIEYIKNLNDLQDQITSAFADFRLPSFVLSNTAKNVINIHCKSALKGLEPFVIGLVTGLRKRFDVVLDIEVEAISEFGKGEHIVFSLLVEKLRKNQVD